MQLGGDIDGEAEGDNSSTVSLSSDGSIVAIGAYINDGNGTYKSGQVRVFKYREYTQSDSNADTYYYQSQIQNSTQTKPLIITENDTTAPVVGNSYWMQLGQDIDGEEEDGSGASVSLSADGSIVAIGAVRTNNYTGHVRVYQYDSTKTTADNVQSSDTFGPVGWNRLGQDIDGEASIDRSGYSVSLSADGSIVAIGAYTNDGTTGTSTDNRGHVRVYQREYTKTTADNDQNSPTFGPVGWNRLGQDIDGEDAGDTSGWSVSLSSDGSIVAIGAPGNSSGHVRVYQLPSTTTSLVLSDVSLNGNMIVSGNVSMNSNVDIVGTLNMNSPIINTAGNLTLGDSEDTIQMPGNLNVTGTVSKASGTFKIDHPLPEKQDTHYLIHSFIEGPRMDNIYRGHIHLVNGLAEINLDTQFNMTEGTFVALNRDISVFTTNEDTWDNVRGKVIGNILTIECQNTDSTALVGYLVIGERQDKHAKETYITDFDGRLIVERTK